MSSLRGKAQLQRRFKALRTVFKPIGRTWADDTVRIMKPMVPHRTGTTRGSIRLGRSTERKATVVGSYVNYFLDKGVKEHDITPKRKNRSRVLRFSADGQTIFSRKVHHPRTRGLGYRERAALRALHDNPQAEQVIKAWNSVR